MNNRVFSTSGSCYLAGTIMLVILLGGGVFAQEQDPRQSQTQIKVFSLKHVPVNGALNSIGNLIGPDEQPSLRVTADERTNSIVASGDSKALSFIEEILLLLDKPGVEPRSNNPNRVFESFKLPRRVDFDLTQRILSTALGPGAGVQMEIDPERGVLFLSGNEKQIAVVSRVLDSLVNSVPSNQQANAYVSVTFVVDSGQIESPELLQELKKPNKQIDAVLVKAKSAGLVEMGQPMVCAKVTNRVKLLDRDTLRRYTEGSMPPAFTNSSESASGFYSLGISGGLALEGETCLLNANVSMRITVKGDSELSANVELPMNHPVIMSVSTIVGVDSLLIVEVKSAD